MESNSAAAVDRSIELVITRVFEAPREQVFDAWLDPQKLAQWIGPRGVKAEIDRLVSQVGGRFRIIMHPDSGGTPTAGGIYREISRPERLVFTWGWEGDHPNVSPDHQTLVTLTFRDLEGKTEMTLHHQGFEGEASRDSHSHGWNGSCDKLAEMLAASG